MTDAERIADLERQLEARTNRADAWEANSRRAERWNVKIQADRDRLQKALMDMHVGWRLTGSQYMERL